MRSARKASAVNSDIDKKNKRVYNIKTDLKNNMGLGLWSVSLRWDHGYFFYFIIGVRVSELTKPIHYH